MVQQLTPDTTEEVIYPESDGQPMADNTEQFQWIVKIKENLEILFASQDNVFIAGNLLWYAVQGDVKVRQAPDAMVVFGRPKGKRGSYKQWQEDNIPPQVVFEILSPGNKTKEMANKLLFYQRHGVEEYYIYDPQTNELTGLLRSGANLEIIEEMNSWISPRLEVRFELTPNTLEIYRPDGQRFLTSVELNQIREQERQRADTESQRAEAESQRAEVESQRAEAESQRAEVESQRAEVESQRAETERQEKEAALLQLELERQRYQDLLTRLQERGIDL